MLLRIVVLGVSALVLGGCLPPVLQVASWTISGASYVFSGKGVGDHMLSIAAEKDCATWRILQGKRICAEHTEKFENGWEAVASTFKVPEADASAPLLDIASDIGEAGEAISDAPVQVATDSGQTPNNPVQVAVAPALEISEDGVEQRENAVVEIGPVESVGKSEPDVTAKLERAVQTKVQTDNAILLAIAENEGDLTPASGPEDAASAQIVGVAQIVSSATQVANAIPVKLVKTKTVSRKYVKNSAFDDAGIRARSNPGIYLVIGSFRNNQRARTLRAKHSTVKTAIMAATVGGKSLFRVLAGPFERPALVSTRNALAKAGVRNSWAMRLCRTTLTPPPCVLAVQQAALPR